MIYYISIGIILSVIIGFFVLSIFEKKRFRDIKQGIIEKLSAYGNVFVVDGKTMFSFQDKQVEVLFFTLKSTEELVINSRVMWEVFRLNKAMLYDQTEFLKSEEQKWIIIYPSISRIKRFINENEMVFVKAFDQVYDYQLILHIELEDYLEDLKHGI
jgi:hypothetical protein